MEVGSYFLLRKKIGFETLKSLIKKLDQIRNDDNFSQLTLFRKVSGETLIDQLTEELKDIVVEDVLAHRTPDRAEYLQKDVIEIVHPSKLERFYECDKFVIREKYSRGKKDVEVFNRSELYFESTKHIFKNLEKPGDRFEIKKKLYTLNIAGFIEGKQKTYANFLSHITAELEYNGHKYFRIDGTWYYLDDKLLELMTNDAISYYERYRLTEDLLLPWPDNKDEDFYNKLHKGKQSFVLDKVLNDNIELCDILKIHDGKIYFIHVKNGFNTKMRELYIQVILSAKRLANDLKNTTGSQYLKKTLKIYNKKNPKHKVDSDLVLNQIKNKELEIVFVMAFKNNFYKGKSTLEKIRLSKSNIAKYSLVQVVKEIQSFEFGINLKDISEL